MRQYRRAKGPYYLLNIMKDKLSETAHETKETAREAAKKMIEETDLEWIGIEQIEFEYVDLHDGSPCLKCWTKSKLQYSDPTEEFPQGPHLHCPKCGTNYEIS